MKLIFDYKFRFYSSKMNEICFNVHWLYFSSIILSLVQCFACWILQLEISLKKYFQNRSIFNHNFRSLHIRLALPQCTSVKTELKVGSWSSLTNTLVVGFFRNSLRIPQLSTSLTKFQIPTREPECSVVKSRVKAALKNTPVVGFLQRGHSKTKWTRWGG